MRMDAAHTFPSRLPKETRSLPPSSPGRARSRENLLQKIVEAKEKRVILSELKKDLLA